MRIRFHGDSQRCRQHRMPEHSWCGTHLCCLHQTFNVSSIALGLNLSHNNRGDVRVVLVPPSTAPVNGHTWIAQSGDPDNNYDIQMSANNDGAGNPALDTNATDNVGEPYYARLVNRTQYRNLHGRRRLRYLESVHLRHAEPWNDWDFQSRQANTRRRRDRSTDLHHDHRLRVGGQRKQQRLHQHRGR